jgi:hypothetical protein
MTADIDPVLPGKIDQRIGFFEPVFTARRMDVGPLHLAFRNDDLAIGDNCFAIGPIRHQRVGPHRGAIWNRLFRHAGGKNLRSRCRKSGHPGQSGRAKGRDTGGLNEKITPGMRRHRHASTRSHELAAEACIGNSLRWNSLRLRLCNIRSSVARLR